MGGVLRFSAAHPPLPGLVRGGTRGGGGRGPGRVWGQVVLRFSAAHPPPLPGRPGARDLGCEGGKKGGFTSNPSSTPPGSADIYGAALLGPPPPPWYPPSPLWFPVVWVPPCPSPLWLRSAAPPSMAIAGWASGVRLLRVWTLGCDTVPTCPELQSQ